MNWNVDQYTRHVSKMYSGGLYDSPDKLDTMWPVIVGGAIFAAIDLGFQPQGAVRWIILAVLIGPGLMWGASFFSMKSGRFLAVTGVTKLYRTNASSA